MANSSEQDAWRHFFCQGGISKLFEKMNQVFDLVFFLSQEILGYLSLYVEPAAAGATLSGGHPVDLVLDAFKNPVTVEATMQKLKVFLEESLKMHGKKFECASIPATSTSLKYIFIFCFCFIHMCCRKRFLKQQQTLSD